MHLNMEWMIMKSDVYRLQIHLQIFTNFSHWYVKFILKVTTKPVNVVCYEVYS